jgi:hypothetical protein
LEWAARPGPEAHCRKSQPQREAEEVVYLIHAAWTRRWLDGDEPEAAAIERMSGIDNDNLSVIGTIIVPVRGNRKWCIRHVQWHNEVLLTS